MTIPTSHGLPNIPRRYGYLPAKKTHLRSPETPRPVFSRVGKEAVHKDSHTRLLES